MFGVAGWRQTPEKPLFEIKYCHYFYLMYKYFLSGSLFEVPNWAVTGQ